MSIATLDYTYNNNHQLTHLTQAGTGLSTQNIGFTYDKLSQLQQTDRQSASNPGHLITDYDYDNVGRLIDIHNRFNTTTISQDTYNYDDGNRLTTKSGTDGNSTVGYGKDNQISAVDHSTRPDEAYSFDALGIRAGWLTDALDSRRVLNDGKYQYQYDDEGNLTGKKELVTGKLTNYTWDDRNRLVKVTSGSQTVEYGYDAEDRRVAKKVNGITTEKYVYDGADIAIVVDAAGTLVERYLFGAGVDNVLSVEKGGAVVWSLGDRQGSVVDLVDAGGNVLNHFVYDSFGGRTQATGVDFRFGYTGRELDGETGLYYYRARYYDSGLGRFISEDPIGFSAGDTNLYRYVNNNPTNFTDPTGTTISGWADDLLNGVDSFVAGFANVVSFGLTNKIREVLPDGANKIAKQNQEGLLYNLGTGAGLIASLALNPAGAGASVAKGFATAYEGFGTVYGVLESAGNILKGEGSAWDALNFIPALQLARASKGSRNVSSAIVEADAAVTQVAKGTQCFVAGTEIQTLYGTKNIEDIHVGDWVLSDDPNTVGEIEYKQVLNTFVKETSNLVDIYIDGEMITTTQEHPFWVPDVGWVAAKDLHAGSLLQTKYESWLDVDKVERHGGLTTVYNFEVAGFHTYFVSDLGLLVHNMCKVSNEGKQLELFPGPPKQLELNLNLGNNPKEFIANYSYVTGPNPNKLIINRVSGKPTSGKGVYIKLHNDQVKTGMAGGEKQKFAGRYGKENPDGGAPIEIEIPQTRHSPPKGLSPDDNAYWTPKRQRRFDEEYIDRTIPQDLRYRAKNAKKPVDSELWNEKRHIFGYRDVPSDFGY